MAFIPDHRIATFIAGVATLLMGAIIVAMAPRAKLHRAAGLFFLLRGGWFTLLAFSAPANDLQGRIAVYCLIALPFSAIWLAHRLHQDFGHRSGLLAWPLRFTLVGVLLLVELAYLLDHDLFFGGPFVVFYPLQFLAYAAIAMATYAQYRRLPVGPSRRALFAFTMGFLAEPIFFATNYAIIQSDQRVQVDIGPLVASLAILATAGWLMVSWWRRSDGVADLRFDWKRAMVLVGVALGTGIATGLDAQLRFAPGRVLDLPVMNAAWTLWTVVATAYAILRYRLFAMDLRIKLLLRLGTTAGLVSMVFLVVSEWLEQQFEVSSTTASIVVSAAIAAALYPVNKLAKRLADGWMPGVGNTNEYRRRRREEIYRAAFERAWQDGVIDPHEKEVLHHLAKGLGLTRDQAEEVEASAATVLSFRPSSPSS